jgi:hypothetical protein
LNRYSLNTQTLGQGTATSSKYVGALVEVAVSFALTNFTVLGNASLYASVIVQQVSTAGFSNRAAILAAVSIQNSTTAVMTRYARFASATQVAVNTIGGFSVGIIQRIASNVMFGVDAVVQTTVKRFGTAAQAIEVAYDVVMGYARYWSAGVNVVESSSIKLSTFGSYAPFERHIIVPEEDRDAEV